ncbi:hypothetical protein SFC08_04415 [Lysinibacillus halotolerans]
MTTNPVATNQPKKNKTDLTFTIYDRDRYKILKPVHSVKYSADFPKVKKPSEFEVYANITDTQLRKASKTTLEGQANILLKELEREKQERERLYPPVYDRTYVERADFTVTDLYNDIVSRMEWSVIYYLILVIVFGNNALSTYSNVLQWDYYRAERKKWRKCRYKFCLNMFAIEGDNIREQRPKRSDSRYCCEQCRKADYEATVRYQKHGSYLPVSCYVTNTADHIDKYYEAHEQAQPLYKLDRENAKGKAQAIVKKRPRKRKEKPEFKPILTVNISTGKIDYPSENTLYK